MRLTGVIGTLPLRSLRSPHLRPRWFNGVLRVFWGRCAKVHRGIAGMCFARPLGLARVLAAGLLVASYVRGLLPR